MLSKPSSALCIVVATNLESFESLFLCDSDVRLLQRNGTVAVVEVVQTFGRIHSQEGGHILWYAGRGQGKKGERIALCFSH